MKEDRKKQAESWLDAKKRGRAEASADSLDAKLTKEGFEDVLKRVSREASGFDSPDQEAKGT